MEIPAKSISLLLIILALQNHLTISRRNPTASTIQLQFQPSTDLHDLLTTFGFPRGLIPDAVKSYTLSDDGHIQIFLQRPCYVQFDQLVYYDKVIKGRIQYGSVTGVSGIQAKKLFVWVTVTGMDADFESDMVEFHVGVLSQKLPVKQFQQVPTCKNKACLELEEKLIQNPFDVQNQITV